MQDVNKDFFDWDGTPDSNVLPTGTFQLHVEELKDVMSKGGKDGIPKRMIAAHSVVEEPAQFAGMAYFENLVVGSAEAPEGMIPGSMGTRAFKGLMKATQIPKANSVQQLLVVANQSKPKYILQVTYYEEKEGEYAGTPRNRTVGYFKVGERAPALAPMAPSAPAAPMATAPGAAVTPGPAVNPPQPFVQPTLPVQPVVPPQPGVGMPGAALPINPTPVTVAPTAAVPTGAVPPVAPAVPEMAVPPGAAPEPTHRCAICQADVPMTQLQAHVNAHQNVGQV